MFCERGAFDGAQSEAVLRAGIAAGLGARVHANQLGPGPGVRLAVEVAGFRIERYETLRGPLPIGFVAANLR